MYITISIILTLLAIREVTTHKSSKKISFLIWFVLTFLLCFRYGQGTDYFNYLSQFESVAIEDSIFENSLYHGEPGWYVLLLVARRSGMSFEMFMGIISLLMMLLIRRGIEKYSPYKALSYLILFPTYYMTYCNSAIRQAIVLALFIGIGIQYLLEGKKKKYIILILCSTFLHYSSLILLIPLISSLSFKKKVLYFIPFIILLSILLYNIFASYLSLFSFSSYLKEDLSIGGIFIRVIMCYIILTLSRRKNLLTNDTKEMCSVLLNIYMIGFVIFMAFSFTGTFAQRLTMPYKALEIFIIPLLVFKNAHVELKMLKFRDNTMGIVLFLALLMNVELVKNIDSYIGQGEYRSNVNILNYPYISVFNESEIYQYRTRFISGD